MIYIVICGIYLVVGGIICLGFSVLFFRMDEGWKKISTFIFGAGTSGGTYYMLNNMCGVIDQNIRIYLLGLLLLSVVVGAVIGFKKLCDLLKGQDGANIIRVLDIVLGQKNFMENYYTTRKREIDSKLNFDEIDKRNKELEAKESALQVYEDQLTKKKESLEEQMKNAICIMLPERQKIPVSNKLLVEFPEHVEAYAQFINDLRIHTKEFVEEIQFAKDNNAKKKVLLDAYFLGICTYVITDLFKDNSSNRIRVHFRILGKKDEYVKLIAITGIQVSARELTPIPIQNANMIIGSYKNRSSMIKSLNIQYHCQGNNDKVWNEYLTYTFDNLFYNDHPFLSFGVSVKNKEKYENLFYFLNYCKIEYVLQECIEKIATECDIVNIIMNN